MELIAPAALTPEAAPDPDEAGALSGANPCADPAPGLRRTGEDGWVLRGALTFMAGPRTQIVRQKLA